MKRFLHILIEILGGVLVLAVLAIGVLIWRLDQQPIAFKSIVPDIEAALNDAAPGLRFKVDAAILASNEKYRALNVALMGIHVFNEQNQVVGTLKEVRLGFNWRNLSHWTLAPVSVQVVHPVVELTRFDNGYIGFNLQESENEEKHPVSVTTLSDALAKAPKDLRHIMITDAVLRYRDQQADYSFRGYNGLFDFHRRDKEITGVMNLNITSRDFDQRIQGTITTDTDRNQTQITFGLKGLKLDQIRFLSAAIPTSAQCDMPFDVLVTAMIDNKLQFSDLAMQVTGEQGNMVYPPYIPDALPVSHFLLSGHYAVPDKKLSVDQIALSLRETKISAKGEADFTPHPDDATKSDTHVVLSAQTENVPLDRLQEYWPHELAQHARDWVTTRIRDGVADRANIDVSVNLVAGQPVDIQKMDGKIEFHNASVNYLPPMPIVRGVNGTAIFDKDNFNITPTSGTLFDTQINRADIKIGSLRHDAHIAIDLDLNGPVRDALNTIASEPLQYMQKMGMSPEQFSGHAKTNLKLNFPLIQHLGLDQVGMQTKATLENVTAKHVVKDLNATAQTLDVSVDTHGLQLKGDAVIENAPAQIKWQEFFGKDAEEPTVLNVKGALTPAVLTGLRLPVAEYFTGSAQTEAVVKQGHDKSIHVVAKADLNRAAISVPEARINKLGGMPGKINLEVDAIKNGPTTLSDVNATWPNFNLSQGMFRWDDKAQLESATVKNFSSGRTHANFVMAPSGNGRSRVVLKGDVVDVSNFWSSQAKGEKDGPNDKLLDISVRAAKLFLDADKPFTNVKADLALRGNEVITADINANVENGSLVVKQIVKKDKGRELYIRANNAGRVLQALDYVDTIYGGTLLVTGESSPAQPKQINGVLTLEDFSMLKAPVMARLLNALSPGGLLNLLNENGLSFSRLRTNFALPDKNTIKLSDGKMNGASLGLSFSGVVQRDTKQLDLKGTIIPMEGINKFLARIPLVGQVLTGLKGEGIIGATYTITGSSENPDVRVNPLSALAPGILRSLLFESGD